VPLVGAPRSHDGGEDQGPVVQPGQAHPEEELEDPAQGGSLGRAALLARQAGCRFFKPLPQRPLPQGVPASPLGEHLEDCGLKGHPAGDLFPGSGTHQAIHGLYQPDSVQHAGHQAQVAQVVDLKAICDPSHPKILSGRGRGAECRL
jgi:hypothetical protein